MPAGIGKNGKLALELVGENPGQLNRAAIIEMFDESQHHSVRMSLGRLIGPASGKLIEDEDGMLWLAEDWAVENVEPETEDAEIYAEEVSKSDATSIINMAWACEEPIEVTPIAANRQMTVIFEVQVHVEGVKRIGISNSLDKNGIIWLPPGARLMRARLGDFEVDQNTEVMGGKYLCLVIPSKKGYVVRYFQAPNGQRFALVWEDED